MSFETEVKDRLLFFERFMKSTIRTRRPGIPVKSPSFVVARQWNSWYPAYFGVEGGCYAILTRERQQNVAIIDPGFNFLQTLNKTIPVEPQDIRSIIVTHFHPDHVAGLEQFLTIAFESHFPCNVFVGETGYNYLKAYQAERLRVHEMLPGQIYRIAEYKIEGKKEEIVFKPFVTYHTEIGLRHRCLGLVIDIETPLNTKQYPYRITVLGDTDGRKEYIDHYLAACNRTSVAVLHLGTYSDNGFGSGYGHLLAPGVRDLVTSICKRIDEQKKGKNENFEEDFSNLRFILLSEFGLELSDQNTIIEKMEPFYQTRKTESLLFLAASFLSKGPNFEKYVFARFSCKYLDEVSKSTSQDLIEWSEIAFFLAILGCSLEEGKSDLKKMLEDLPATLVEEDLMKMSKSHFISNFLKKHSYLNDNIEQVIGFLIRNSEDPTSKALEKLLEFCERIQKECKNLHVAQAMFSDEQRREITDKLRSILRISGSIRVGSVRERNELIDSNKMKYIWSSGIKNLYRFSILMAAIIYKKVISMKNDPMTSQIAGFPNKPSSHKVGEKITDLICSHIQEHVTKELGLDCIPASLISAEIGLTVTFGSEIKILHKGSMFSNFPTQVMHTA